MSCDAGDAGDVGAGDADDVDDVDADDADDVGDVDVSDANDVSHSKRGSGRVWAARAGAGGRWAGGAGRVVGFKSVLGMNHNSALPLVQVPMPTQLLVSIFCLPGSLPFCPGKAASGSGGSAMEEQGRREWLEKMKAFQRTLDTRRVKEQEEDVRGLKRAQRDRTPKEGASTSTVTVTYGITREMETGANAAAMSREGPESNAVTIAATINLVSMPKKEAQGLAALDLAPTCVRRTSHMK